MSLHPTAADDESMISSQTVSAHRDFSMMSEEEQFEYAMQMSLGESSATTEGYFFCNLKKAGTK